MGNEPEQEKEKISITTGNHHGQYNSFPLQNVIENQMMHDPGCIIYLSSSATQGHWKVIFEPAETKIQQTIIQLSKK